MRAAAVASVTALVCALFTLPANASPTPDRLGISPTAAIVQVAGGCGRGYRWVPPGYAKHGKYRLGHCAPK
jgi:hypothetical protein